MSSTMTSQTAKDRGAETHLQIAKDTDSYPEHVALGCRKLNKLGTFNLSQLGQSKSPIAEFMRNARKNNDNFEESLLKLVRFLTAP